MVGELCISPTGSLVLSCHSCLCPVWPLAEGMVAASAAQGQGQQRGGGGLH